MQHQEIAHIVCVCQCVYACVCVGVSMRVFVCQCVYAIGSNFSGQASGTKS